MAWNKYEPQKYSKDRSGHMSRRRLALIESVLNGTRGNVLDYGCGTGNDAFAIAMNNPKRKVFGIDTDASFVSYAKRKFRLRNLSYSTSIPPSLANCGFVYSIDVLHHVQAVNATIKRISNLLEKGGKWLVIEPNIWNPKVFYNQVSKRDERLFFQHKTEILFRNAGFRIAKKGLFLLIPYNIHEPNKLLIEVESLLESIIGGSVYYILEKI